MSSGEPIDRLIDGLRKLGFEHPARLAGRLAEFSALLLEANTRTNLVGAKTLEALVAPHLLDSLAPLAGLRLASPVVDVGSGGGMPGIPAALAFPASRFVLLEPRTKRAAFLKKAVASLGLSNVEVEQISAQTASKGPLRAKAGTVLVRALAKPAENLELSLPLLAPQGRLILYLGRAATPTKAEAATMKRLGARLAEARRLQVPYLEAQRHVWIIKKAPVE